MDQIEKARAVHDIGLANITIASGRRSLQNDTVEKLVESIMEIGLLNPISIRSTEEDRFFLVAGRHRLEAARRLKWESIPAIILEGITADEAELCEIDENLIRAGLGPAEQAACHARRKELHEQLYPETKRGGDRKSDKQKSKPQNADLISYSENAAAKTGKSRDTVERAVKRGTDIPNVGELAGTSLDKGNELDALAKLPSEQQAELIEKAKAGEKVSAMKITKGQQQRKDAIPPGKMEAIGREYLDTDQTRAELSTKHNVGENTVTRAGEIEKARRESKIDPESLPISAQKKLEAALKQEKRRLQADFYAAESRRQAEFNAAVQDGIKQAINETVLPQYNKRMKEARQVLQSRKRGIMTRDTFKLILACLHPDQSASKERLSQAFRVFNELELVFISEKEMPTTTPRMPHTYEEMMQMRAEMQAERQAKRRKSSNEVPQKV